MGQAAFAKGNYCYGTMKTGLVKLINCLDFKASGLNHMIHSPKIYKRICSSAPHSANLKEKNAQDRYCANLAT